MEFSGPSVSIHIGGIPELREALQRELDTRPLMERAATRVEETIRRHLRKRNLRPSKKDGWPASGFWGKAAESVATEVGDTAATIRIGSEETPGVLLRLHGGVVKPKPPRKAIAIPQRPEVAGVWPSEYTGAKRVFLLVKKAMGKAWLAEREEGGHLRILWKLLKRTIHKPDPSVLPTETELLDAAATAIRNALNGGAA